MRLLYLFLLLSIASCSNKQLILLDPSEYIDEISSDKLGPYCSNHADTVEMVLQLYGVKTTQDERNRVLIDEESANDKNLIMSILDKSLDRQWLEDHKSWLEKYSSW